MELNCELVDPRRPNNAFSVLHTAYKTAKRLVKQYGNVRVFTAEASHRPSGTWVEGSNGFVYTDDRARNRTEFSHLRQYKYRCSALHHQHAAQACPQNIQGTACLFAM